ncbi:LysM peptidoglycan-binding domain-containing protein [Deinococcus sp. MIMF12]|uniref:LysM peptidoglycan-binding domain-containing protein n=1 Tax=Deinococcus rhizophilus TaxID=3049544 RepID=A0ABT7JHG1_9DEIO|nr:LysM peptidoglycan-binding domain-containing protein [Deinococcus rhizophilus]MDL2343940.1 LysM peptidoglycan-binding domain-containing protein [Deinococcus rhizophilus]
MFSLFLLLTLTSLPTAWAASSTVTVRSGDTLSGLSQRTGVSVARLRSLNSLRGNLIRPGQVLRLRAAGAAAKPAGGLAPYTVRRGDTLSAIAQRAGVSVAALRAANGLPGSLIRTGQKLKVPPRGTRTWPPKTAARAAPPRPTTEVRLIHSHVAAKPGETLGTLARRYRTTEKNLLALNDLGRRRLYPGQRVLVPQRIPVPIPPKPTGKPVSVKRLTPLNIPVRVVNVDLRWRDVLVTPVLPPGGIGRGARVSTLSRVSGAKAVVNGSYFHPQSYIPAGDLVVRGRLVALGRIPAGLAITPDNRATIRTVPARGDGAKVAWRGMETVVAAGPRILKDGLVNRQYSSAFRDPALFGRAARSAVGLVSNRDLVLVTTHARLTTTEMGKVMARLGVRDALLLDGGSSAGVAWNGTAVLESVRSVAYGIGVFTGYEGRRYAR